MLPEYPGYSLYSGKQDQIETDRRVCEDLNGIFDFLVNSRGFSENRIIVTGRSIGSGPSCFISKKRRPGALILISPFTSLQSAAKSMFGNFCGGFVRERFNNLECIQSVLCPVMIIHGKKDLIIPFSHAEQLYRNFFSGPFIMGAWLASRHVPWSDRTDCFFHDDPHLLELQERPDQPFEIFFEGLGTASWEI